jgi:hypothetical protein
MTQYEILVRDDYIKPGCMPSRQLYNDLIVTCAEKAEILETATGTGLSKWIEEFYEDSNR